MFRKVASKVSCKPTINSTKKKMLSIWFNSQCWNLFKFKQDIGRMHLEFPKSSKKFIMNIL